MINQLNIAIKGAKGLFGLCTKNKIRTIITISSLAASYVLITSTSAKVIVTATLILASYTCSRYCDYKRDEGLKKRDEGLKKRTNDLRDSSNIVHKQFCESPFYKCYHYYQSSSDNCNKCIQSFERYLHDLKKSWQDG